MPECFATNADYRELEGKMDEIKAFLRLMDKEALIELAASMLFQTLVNVVDLSKALKDLENAKKVI